VNAPAKRYVRIDNTRLNELVASAEGTSEERCGFLLGHERAGRVVTTVIPAVNVAKNPLVHFEVDPLEYLRAEKYAAKYGLELIGIYHSHPNGTAVPSETDRCNAHPHFSYVILSMIGQRFDDIRSWRLNHNGQFEEEPIYWLSAMADNQTN
jgi:proteasome lid subunit RPN8/RPN11